MGPGQETRAVIDKWCVNVCVLSSVLETVPAAVPEANGVHCYLRMDYHELRSDALKERQLLQKLAPGEDRSQGQSVLATSMQFGLAIEYERSDHVRRVRLFLSEILRVLSKVSVCVSLV